MMAITIPMRVFDAFIELNRLLAEQTAPSAIEFSILARNC